MEPVVDTLIYLVVIGGAIPIVGILLVGICRMNARICRINARLIWRTIARQVLRWMRQLSAPPFPGVAVKFLPSR